MNNNITKPVAFIALCMPGLQGLKGLDLPGVEALETLMKNYGGTILFISHVKRLLENVADLVYEIQQGQIVQI